MTFLVWSAFGMTVGAAVLYGTLGLRQPIDRTYLSFAFIMTFLAAYLYFEWRFYRSITAADAVTAVRHQVVAAHGFLGCILVFVPAYTHVRLPRSVLVAFWSMLALLFLANLMLPYGIWFSEQPVIVTATFRGESYTTAIERGMTMPQYIHALYVLALFGMSLACTLRVFRRGLRKRGAILAGSLVVVILPHVIDIVRDTFGGTWPYLAEYGLVAWGLIMSLQLALDFRNSEQRLNDTLRRVERDRAALTAIVNTTLHVRDKLNTPLQTLELGLALRSPHTPDEVAALAHLHDAVVSLSEFGRAVERTAHPERTE